MIKHIKEKKGGINGKLRGIGDFQDTQQRGCSHKELQPDPFIMEILHFRGMKVCVQISTDAVVTPKHVMSQERGLLRCVMVYRQLPSRKSVTWFPGTQAAPTKDGLNPEVSL